VKHANELGQPSRLRSGWAKFSPENGGVYGKYKVESKGFPR
jgi:hypothetical protein